ncbi:MAG: hypothetical protein KAU20_02595 [Nanoarchaeota archaeon]|nr:hypothetical protein [Nanoarchaeota archaeon]
MYRWTKEYIETIKDYNKIAKIERIARRYFAMNSFDGVLVILGILIAAFFGNIIDKKIIIIACVGALIAIGISGLWGAYLTEGAEREREQKKLEKMLKRDLEETKIGRAFDFAVVSASIINGLSPFIAGIIILIPFFIIPKITLVTAYYSAFAIAFIELFFLGIFLGKVSKESTLLYGLKMLVAGVVCAVIIYLLGI